MEGEVQEINNVHSESNSSNVEVLDVIPVQLVDNGSYQTFKTVENAQRTKYYKQTYRRAWEQMPDFAGWLTGVEGEPTRAFCIYCQKTLHAHRLSLLKHTCTIRHQKAAQLHKIRKIRPNKAQENQEVNLITDEGEMYNEEDVEEEEREQYSEVIEEVEERYESDLYQERVEEEEAEETEENGEIHVVEDPIPTPSGYQTHPPISTQVTDAVKGMPVTGLAVSLYKLIYGKWTYINEGYTNFDGRFAKFVDAKNFTTGRYKLHYDVDKYFEAKKQTSLYPFIEIVFDCKNSSTNYHIPLILSPNSYTTYKGSL